MNIEEDKSIIKNKTFLFILFSFLCAILGLLAGIFPFVNHDYGGGEGIINFSLFYIFYSPPYYALMLWPFSIIFILIIFSLVLSIIAFIFRYILRVNGVSQVLIITTSIIFLMCSLFIFLSPIILKLVFGNNGVSTIGFGAIISGFLFLVSAVLPLFSIISISVKKI